MNSSDFYSETVTEEEVEYAVMGGVPSKPEQQQQDSQSDQGTSNKVYSTDNVPRRAKMRVDKAPYTKKDFFNKLFHYMGFDIRNPQKEIINFINKSTLGEIKNLNRDNKDGYYFCSTASVIEAGTGTGKTLAYLSSLLELIYNQPKTKTSRDKIIVSTNTAALQDQMYNKDIPVLSKAFQELTDYELKYNVVKGATRYFCHEKYKTIDVPTEELTRLKGKIDREEWDGCFDSLEGTYNKEVLDETRLESGSCLGKKCEFKDFCSYYKNKMTMNDVDILITNHSKLLSLANREEFDFSEYWIVVDEAHNLPHKAVEECSSELSLDGITDTLKSFQNFVSEPDIVNLKNNGKYYIHNGHVNTFRDIAKELNELIKGRIETYVDKRSKDKKLTLDNNVDFSSNNDTGDVGTIYNRLSSFYDNYIKSMDAFIKELASELDKSKLKKKMKYISRCRKFENTFGKLGRAIYNLKLIASGADYIICWVDKAPRQDNSDNHSISIDFIVPSMAMKKMFWNSPGIQIENSSCTLKQENLKSVHNHIIMTSATLKAVGKFRNFIGNLGIPEETVHTLDTGKPFDYEKSNLILYKNNIDINSDAYIKFSTEKIQDFIEVNEGGILVLFASYKAMNDVYKRLDNKTRSAILKQNDYSKSYILKLHKKAVDTGRKSVIFGMDSFSEGVDLPGDYLTLVVIHKIPFKVPVEPKTKAYINWLKNEGYNPFSEYFIPEASFKLTQGVGRLIRSTEDTGNAVILDNRMTNKQYGKALLRDIPDFNVIKEES